MEEISELLQHLGNKVDKPYCMLSLLAPSMSNNIASLVFGKRMKYDNPVRQMLSKTIIEGPKEAGRVGWILFFPLIQKIIEFFGIDLTKKFRELYKEVRNYVMKEINEHEETLDPNNIRDFIDGYLIEAKRRKDYPLFSKAVLQDLVSSFFTAGSETVRQTIDWLILRAASDQTAQNRIYEEIEEIIGQNRPPNWPDLKQMPYTNAFIMEMERWRTLIPLTLFRCTLADTELNGYFIPKGTQVISNQWAIHHEPEYWGPDADEFRPERFLTEDGKEVKKYEQLIPFSIGKRACPGEPLAKVEVFLYFVSILQRFHVKMPDGKVADFEEDAGFGMNPKAQDVVFTKRN